jgi:hypothetical protein
LLILCACKELTQIIPPKPHARRLGRRPKLLPPDYSSSTPLSPPPVKTRLTDNSGVLFLERGARSVKSLQLGCTIGRQYRFLGMWLQHPGCFGSLEFGTTEAADCRALASPFVRRDGVGGTLPFRLDAVLVRLAWLVYIP